MTDSIGTSTTYTAKESTSYTYSNLGTVYYKDGDTYYLVEREYQFTGFFSVCYYLYYTNASNNKVYLYGTSTTDTQPTTVTSMSSTIYTGVLYTATTTTTTKLDALKTAVTNFVATIQTDAATNNVDHRIAIAGFASNSSDGSSGNNGSYTISPDSSSTSWINTGLFVNGKLKNYGNLGNSDYESALVSVNDNGSVASSINTAIDNFAASGATRTQYGLTMANNVFENNSDTYTKTDGTTGTRKRIVVVFTDGQPGKSSYDDTEANAAISVAYTTKNTYKATVYSIGLYTTTQDNDVTNFMNYISSNYPEAKSTSETGNKKDTKYYMIASDAAELNNVFDSITTDATSSSTSVTLNADSVMKDIIGDGFTLPDDFMVKNNVTIKTYEGSVDAESGDIIRGAETSNSASASVSENTVSVTGFNYAEKYISSGHDGEMICVTITGILPTTNVTTDTAVNTNDATSGIYADTNATEATATFEQPQTIITKKLYVLDYAKEASLIGLDQDSSVTGIVGSFQKVTSENTSLTQSYGKSSLSENSLSYTPTTTNWNGYDSFYVFGQTTSETVKSYSANTNGNLWSKVSVIPANNVYYEDDFVTTYTDETKTTKATVGIEYTGDWMTVGNVNTSVGNNTETANGNTYGWETSLSDDDTYSDGTAHAAGATTATATFTFTGTGVDIYSRTDINTGNVIVTLKGTSEGNTTSKVYICDNLSESGTYYQIPTVSFEDLEYDTYTVTIKVATNATDNEYTYYLDGIRVYNPLGTVTEEDGDAYEAYKADNELNAVFTEVRNILIDADSFTANYDGAGGVVFIDNNVTKNGETVDPDNTTSTIGTYTNYGPENEVYLAAGQSIAFKLNSAYLVEGVDAHFYLGLKSADGLGTNATVTDGSNTKELAINHSTDLYYEITPTSDGYIMVENTGSNLLSITKLRATSYENVDLSGDVPGEEGTNAIALLSTEEVNAVLAYASTFDSLTTVENVDDETTDTEITEDDIIIESPEVDDTDDNEEVEDTTTNESQSIFGGIINSIRN